MALNKTAFCLASLVVLLAFCFAASSAMAQFEIKLDVSEGNDISFADGNQVFYRSPDSNPVVTIKIMSTKVVDYHATATAATAADDPAVVSGTALGADDFTVIAYNKFSGIATTDAPTLRVVTPSDPADGMHFTAELGNISGANAETTRVLIVLKKDSVELADPRVELNDDGTRKDAGKNKEATIELHYFHGIEQPDQDVPRVYSIKRPGDLLLPVTEATFDVVVLLSEEPKKDTFTKDRFDISNATWGDPVALGPIPEDRDGPDNEIVFNQASPLNNDNMPSTGYNERKIYMYILTVTPKYENKNDIVIKINDWETQNKVNPEKYTAPATDAQRTEGVDQLTVKVGKEVLPDKTAGIEVVIAENTVIPKDGYVVVAKDLAGSAVRDPEPGDTSDNHLNSPKNTARQPFGLTYNRVAAAAIPNLETLLLNGGTIDIVGAESLIISEIMWGSDASVDADSTKSQYIELRNTSGAEIKAAANAYKLIFYTAGSTLPDASVEANNVQDRVGTVGASGYWSVAGKGQSGRTGVGEAPGDLAAVTPTQALISMQRVIDATGVAADGTMASSWAASTPPGLNFDPTIEGTRIGSPGRAPVAYPVAPTPDPEPVTVPVAEAEDIMITEIMVDTGSGRLPQWVELTNVSGADVSLAGWSLVISNSEADADVIGATVSINLSGTLGVGGGEDAGGTMGKSLLLVGGTARSSSNLSGSDRVVDISSQVDETGRYTFISTMAFMAALIPPQETGVLTYGDTAGNLGADEAWDIPMADGGRSSLIRREMLDDGMATMGTSANGWVLASSTALVSGPTTWYGSDEDAGTPGYDAGGPLPVELSHFRPARDKAGAVVITWSTQSELNNAGFFIKRSQQRDGQFQIINAAMIQGAGTSSEKQFYTYTDTTAQPNVVYYYQIEDVSLDGNRQTLTNSIRLKGHVGAAGKATTTWGDLKTQE